MLKTVVVVSESDAPYQKALKAAEGKDVAVLRWNPEQGVPAAAAAVIADAKGLSSAVEVATAIGAHLEELLCLIADAIDCREEFRPGSYRRVLAHATRFAQALEFSPSEQLVLERGTLVRDIGKLRVPNKVLLKSDLLTYHERATLQEHPAFGAELLLAGHALRDVVDIVRSHHESHDGTGYPDGLEGDQIPRLARIVKIVDVYCAMTSPRHYRKGQSTHEQALDYLREERGTHFDPELLDRFISAEIGRPPEME